MSLWGRAEDRALLISQGFVFYRDSSFTSLKRKAVEQNSEMLCSADQ